MPKITAKSMIDAFKSFNTRVGFFYKAILTHLKNLIKIDSSIGNITLPSWVPLWAKSLANFLNKIFLSVSFSNLIHTANSFVYVAKVINCACKLVELSIQKNKEYKDILDSFKTTTTTPENPLQLTFYSNLNIGPCNNAQDIITAIENALLHNRDLQGTDKEHKEKRKKLKQKLSFIHFCSNNPDFVQSIDNAKNTEEKISQLELFLNNQIAQSIPAQPDQSEKRKNKLVNDLRKRQKEQKLAWFDLSMAILTLLTYAVKPLLWAIEFVLSAVIAATFIAALTMAFAIATIGVGLLNIAFGLYKTFNEMSTKIPKKWDKKYKSHLYDDYLEVEARWDCPWNKLTWEQKLIQYLRYFFTEGYYGDIAGNLAVLLANVVLAVILLAGISMPWVVITLSAAALACGIIAFIGALHKEIKETNELTVFKILMGTLKVLLIGGILTALSVAAFVSPPIAVGLVVAALLGGIAYVGILWYNSKNNTAPKSPYVGPMNKPEHEPLMDPAEQQENPYTYTMPIRSNDECTPRNDSPPAPELGADST